LCVKKSESAAYYRIKRFLFENYIFSPMVRPQLKSYYAAAIILGLCVGLAIRDMAIGILLAVVLMICVSGLRKRNAG